MKNIIRLMVVFFYVLSFCLFSCSDELDLSSSKDHNDGILGEGQATSVRVDQNNSSNLNQEGSKSKSNSGSGSISYHQDKNNNQDSLKDLFSAIETLPVSDSEKSILEQFVQGLLSSQNLDMSTLLAAISGGTLSDLGINNELVQEFLTLLMAGSLSGSGAIVFVKVLEMIAKNIDTRSGSGSGSGIDSLLNDSVLELLLGSSSIESFIEQYLDSSLKGGVLDYVSTLFEQLSSGKFN